jgi:L-rhamnose mutarotase
MGGFFEDLDVPPDEGFLLLEEVFHLEDQLPATHPASTRSTPSPTSSSTSRTKDPS